MKRIFITFLAFYAITLFSLSEITFDSPIHDFGEIEDSKEPYLHEFKFTNTGTEPFTIMRVKAG